MSARDDLLGFVNRVIPSGDKGDKIKTRLLGLVEAYRDEFAAQQVEAHARPPAGNQVYGSFLDLRQAACGYCHARSGEPCRTSTGRVVPAGEEHHSRVQAWRARWLAAQPRLSRKAREAVVEVTPATVVAGMRNRPGFR